jgi:hypothetical protein
MEAPGGFEPPHRSFADCSLTTWVRRHGRHYNGAMTNLQRRLARGKCEEKT